MKHLNSFSRRTFLLAGLVAAFFTGNSSPLQAGTQYIPPGNLTVTVQEQGDGSVRFSLSGTAYMQEGDWYLDETNYSDSDETPPFAAYVDFDLPAGLTLTVPLNNSPASAPEGAGPEEALPSSTILDVHSLYGDYYTWRLGHVESGYLERGDAITGAGSITTTEIPFNLFTPGTFFIQARPSYEDSESDTSGALESHEDVSRYPYSITYKVIAAKPSLAVSGPGAFPKTILRKTSRAQQVTITNNGSAPLTDLTLSVAGRGSRDFSISTLSRTNLPAGASTLVDVRFRPNRTGKRRATLTATGVYTPPTYPEIEVENSAEEIVLEPVVIPAPTPVVVSGSTTLTGKGLSGKTLRPNTPRYPYGRR